MSLLFVSIMISPAFAQDPCPISELSAPVESARALLIEGEPERALQEIEAIEEGLACTDALVSGPAILSSAFQVGAAAAFQIGDDERAATWYESAIRLAPEAPFDDRLAPSADGFEQARSQALSAEGQVRALGPVNLNGVMLPAGASRAVPAGDHLVQHLDSAGAVQSGWVEVERGAAIDVGSAPPIVEPTAAGTATTKRVVLGGALLGVGAASLWAGGSYRETATTYRIKSNYTDLSSEEERYHDRAALYANLFTFGGAAAAGIGAASFARGALSTKQTMTPGIWISGRW